MRRWEAWTNHVGWGLTAASGLLYGILKYFVKSADPYSRLSSPWQPTVLAIHVLAAPVAVFGLGLLFRRHALARLAGGEGEGRRSGGSIFWLAIPLGLSGYVLQVVTGEAARQWLGWSHAAAGLLFAVAYAAHAGRSRFLPEDSPELSTQTQVDGISGDAS